MSSENAGIQFTAYNLNGAPQHTSEWIGKGPVVLNFWGTWCPPCRREIPDLVRVYNELHPQGIEILGLAVRDRPNAQRQAPSCRSTSCHSGPKLGGGQPGQSQGTNQHHDVELNRAPMQSQK